MKTYIFFIVCFWLGVFSLQAQTYSEDIDKPEEMSTVELVKNNLIPSSTLADFGIGTEKNERNNTLRGNSVFITQVGELNTTVLRVRSSASEIRVNQEGNSNIAGLDYNVKTVITDIKQQGDRNIALDVVQDPTANISLDLQQNGNDLNFQRIGSNNLTESLQFIQTEASPSLIIRSSTNGNPDN